MKEPGLYELIFKSELPQAKIFRDWVFEDVLPSIRQHGFYKSKLLAIQQFSETDLLQLEDVEKKELKLKCNQLLHQLKDSGKQECGQKGGTALWKKIHDKEEELDSLRKKVEDVLSILNGDE